MKNLAKQVVDMQINAGPSQSIEQRLNDARANQKIFYREYVKELNKKPEEQDPKRTLEARQLYSFWREKYLRLDRRLAVYAGLNML